MILKTYIFSYISGHYQQYTNDSSGIFLQDVCKRSTDTNQIAIHRNGNLIYYSYTQKSRNNDIYGLCALCGEVCTDVKTLFQTFRQTFESAACKGILFRYDDNGDIKKNINDFSTEAAEVDNLFGQLKDALNVSIWEKLPPEDLSVPLDCKMRFSLDEDDPRRIVNGIRHYHNVIITLQNNAPSCFALVVQSKNDEIKRLKSYLAKRESLMLDLETKNSRLNVQRRNIMIASVFGIISAVLLVIIYFKVINPSEVTHYETGEFVYYGPLRNKKPHGVGVAIYPDNDKSGRKYYVGNFNDGIRTDTVSAILLYTNGDYYYGTMDNDKFKHGLYCSSVERTFFTGEFKNDSVYNGEWYHHEKMYNVIKGEKRYE